MANKDVGGRPTKFKPEFIGQAAKLAKLGATDPDIADFFGVSRSTLNNWKNTKDGFLDALKRSKAEADQRVEDSLYHRALGYSHDHDDIRVVDGQVVITPTVKHYPPDSTALIFWLKNRQPEKWREKPADENDDDAAPVNIVINTVDATIDRDG